VDDPTPQLRARARAGDTDAFGAVFDACAKSVYNHAFRLTGDWSAAEEVMAMTFLEAWRNRMRIAEDGGSLRPWLLGIATNLARGQRRALAGLPRPELEILALCVWSGLGYAEAAEALSIPVGTVRSRLSRARAKLGKLTERELRGNSREPPTVSDQLMVGHAIAGLSDKLDTSGKSGKEARR
jgi:DNA-directed RNA polymerase specialized sigma24 family protein